MRTTPKMGLTSWDAADDPYNPQQLAGNWQIVDFHDHSPGRGVPLPAGALAPGAVLSSSIAAGVIGSQHLNSTLIQDLGYGLTGRGSVSVPTAQSTSSASPALLTTPDQVSGIILNTGGMILVDYQALWEVGAGTGTAILQMNGVNVQGSQINNTFSTVSTTTTATRYSPLYTSINSLGTVASTTTDSTELTTGQVFGAGTVLVFAAAGTYNVGILFSNSAGTTFVKNRHLSVRSVNYQ